jgi:two-component system, chemotaxis family, protein-glutamate methylesterase/glutaminase
MSLFEHRPKAIGAPTLDSNGNRRLVVVAASAGGLNPLIALISALPAGFPAPLVVVQHRSAELPFQLPDLLAPLTHLQVRAARDGEMAEPGTIYLSPPGMHMAAEAVLRVMDAPTLSCARPSADLMFYSAAQVYREGCIGVVLSGNGMDGAFGCRAIADAGGTVIAQTPASCAYPSMPTAAATLGPAKLILNPDAMGQALADLIKVPLHANSAATPRVESSPLSVPTGLIKVLLAEDHHMIRDGLRMLLATATDITIVDAVADGRAAIDAAAHTKPDVVVMDLAMPDIDGIEATRQIRALHPAVKVIVLSAQTDIGSIGRAFEAGAIGFVSKQRAFEELLHAIRTVMTTGECVKLK